MLLFGIDIPFFYIKWIIIVIFLFSIIAFFLWIVCGYYIYKWFKVSINNYNFYLNDYNTECKDLLKKYGNYPIKRIYLVRHPLTKFMERVLNLVTFNKFQQELDNYKERKKDKSFYPYHTMLYFELKISKNKSKFLVVDKNNCLRISDKLKILPNYELRDLHIKKNKHTLNNILESTRKRIGNNKFFNWEIYRNNCQILIMEVLKTLNKFNKSNKKFMYQNTFANELEKLGNFSEFSLHTIRSLTNTMNLLENIIGFTLWQPV